VSYMCSPPASSAAPPQGNARSLRSGASIRYQPRGPVTLDSLASSPYPANRPHLHHVSPASVIHPYRDTIESLNIGKRPLRLDERRAITAGSVKLAPIMRPPWSVFDTPMCAPPRTAVAPVVASGLVPEQTAFNNQVAFGGDSHFFRSRSDNSRRMTAMDLRPFPQAYFSPSSGIRQEGFWS